MKCILYIMHLLVAWKSINVLFGHKQYFTQFEFQTFEMSHIECISTEKVVAINIRFNMYEYSVYKTLDWLIGNMKQSLFTHILKSDIYACHYIKITYAWEWSHYSQQKQSSRVFFHNLLKVSHCYFGSFWENTISVEFIILNIH